TKKAPAPKPKEYTFTQEVTWEPVVLATIVNPLPGPAVVDLKVEENAVVEAGALLAIAYDAKQKRELEALKKRYRNLQRRAKKDVVYAVQAQNLLPRLRRMEQNMRQARILAPTAGRVVRVVLSAKQVAP